MSEIPQPPVHVRTAFGATEEPELLDASPLWRCGPIAFRPVADPVESAWVAQVLATLEVPRLRIGRPLRSTDGRWVIGGWSAFRFIDGRPEPRHDEVIAASLRLHEATALLERPRFLNGRGDMYSVADRAAWGEEQPELDAEKGGRLFELLAASRRDVQLRPQIVHGEGFGTVLFSGDADPGIVELSPYWRPPEWAAAVAAVDALSWGGADPGILERWAHLPEWPQALLRALLFRLAVNAMHPHATPDSLRGLENSAHEIGKLL
ncbi:TIGR02569 family protein [Sciscionella marina]|uniref:TIGR02569 family protein n=1 Tax=Sciscionella marina TaxID=508770 RepID=UPI00037019BF|nr:TIGR02569 family protein [Sciscionella marina]